MLDVAAPAAPALGIAPGSSDGGFIASPCPWAGLALAPAAPPLTLGPLTPAPAAFELAELGSRAPVAGEVECSESLPQASVASNASANLEALDSTCSWVMVVRLSLTPARNQRRRSVMSQRRIRQTGVCDLASASRAQSNCHSNTCHSNTCHSNTWHSLLKPLGSPLDAHGEGAGSTPYGWAPKNSQMSGARPPPPQ